MFNVSPRTVALVLLLLGAPELGAAPIKPEAVERGKKATALIEVSSTQGDSTGSAFCIHNSGLFITEASVVKAADVKGARIRLVVDCGLPTQQILAARALRKDDKLGLALLQVNGATGLTELELARDEKLGQSAEVTTFGYPFGRMPAAGSSNYPEVTVAPSRITTLRSRDGRLLRINFDNRLNPGTSGGPVLDASGTVVGVALAAEGEGSRSAAIVVSQLVAFLRTPGLIFEPAPVAYEDRAKPVTWTIKVQPPTPLTKKLPDKLSVAVTIADGVDKPRTYAAKPAGDGTFKVTVTPVANDPERLIPLEIYDTSPRRLRTRAAVKECEVTVGSTTYRLSDLKILYGGKSPHVKPLRGEVASGPIRGMAKTGTSRDKTRVTIDLSKEIEVEVSYVPPPVRRVEEFEAAVELKQDSKVLASVRKSSKLTVSMTSAGRPSVPAEANILPVLADEQLLKLGGALNVDGKPKGAGKAIKPPAIAIPPARMAADAADQPLVRKIDGTISDVAVAGGGRFLFLTLKESRKLAVFDVSAADVVKTIVLPSSNALVAAGASKLLIVYPDERLMERYDLATLKRDFSARPIPIKGRILRLAMGSDSDGPVLTFWRGEGPGVGFSPTRFSFIDLDSLNVLKIGSISKGAGNVVAGMSASGRGFIIDYSEPSKLHIRASADGTLFGMWNTGSRPSGFTTLKAQGGGALEASYQHEELGQVVPGPDGRTVYTGAGVRYSALGQPLGTVDTSAALFSRDMVIPSADPSYYLSIGGLPSIAYDPNAGSKPGGPVTAAVHSAADGSPLFKVYGLDEMAGTDTKAEWHGDDFTTDKRFHLIPAAEVLITIPASNDRVVMRSPKLGLEGAGGDRLLVVSPPDVAAVAGQKLVHQIVARSKPGGITFALVRGPEGLAVAPDGTVTWAVPAGQKKGEATAVVSVGDASGAERFHTLKIHVE